MIQHCYCKEKLDAGNSWDLKDSNDGTILEWNFLVGKNTTESETLTSPNEDNLLFLELMSDSAMIENISMISNYLGVSAKLFKQI